MNRTRLKTLTAALLFSALASAAHARCSLSTLAGNYGYFREGTSSTGPLASIGIATYDGRGTIRFSQTTVKNGVQGSDIGDPPDAYGYTLNSNCTGTFFDPSTGDAFAEIVAVDDGKQVDFISLSPGNTVYGVARKVSDWGN